MLEEFRVLAKMVLETSPFTRQSLRLIAINTFRVPTLRALFLFTDGYLSTLTLSKNC
jgi:hypothetical protein